MPGTNHLPMECGHTQNAGRVVNLVMEHDPVHHIGHHAGKPLRMVNENNYPGPAAHSMTHFITVLSKHGFDPQSLAHFP